MHQSQAHAHPEKPSMFWRTYMGVWVVLAGASLTYLGLFALNPDAQEQVAARVQQEFGAPAHQQAAAPPQPEAQQDAQLNDKVRALNDELASLRAELKRAQEAPANTQTAESVTQEPTPITPGATSPLTTASIPRAEPPTTDPAVGDSTAAGTDTGTYGEPLGEQLKPATTAVPVINPPATASEPQQQAPRETTRRPGRNLATRPLRAGSLPPLPARDGTRPSASLFTPSTGYTAPARTITQRVVQPTVLNRDGTPATQDNYTAAVTAPTPPATSTSFGTPTVSPVASQSALVLSAASSVTGLRASWLLLTSRYGSTLSGFSPRYVIDPSSGNYLLLAGPVADRSQADHLCNQLRAEDVRCGVTTFAGTPL